MMKVFSCLAGDERPVLLKLRSSPALIVTTCSFAVFTDIFLYAVIVPVLPFALETRVNISEDRTQYWISISLAVYGAALLASSPVWGYLADRIKNRRVPMLFGLVLLAAATIFLCLSTSIAMLLVGRALQGLSAALTWTVGLALIVDTVDRSHIGTAMGWVGTATSLGILSGPLLGGIVYGRAGYYSVFAMCFGLLAVDIFLRLIIIEVKDAKKWLAPVEPEDHNSRAEQDDSGDVEAGQDPPSATALDQRAGAARPQSPIATLWGLLSKPRLLAALWGTLVEAIIQTAFDSVVPLYVAEIFGWGSIGAGLIFLPVVLPFFLSPLIGAVGDRCGPKWLATFGFALATPFLVCLRFVDEDTIRHKIMLCGLLFATGFALACVFGPLMAEITWSVQGDAESKDDADIPYAQAYGLYNMAFSGGAMVGPILGGMIRDSAGWGTVGWSLAIVTAFTAVTQLIWTGSSFRLERPT